MTDPLAQLKELGAMGWSLTVRFDGDKVEDIRGHAGDANCSHRKEYDPTDGHGFSTFEVCPDYRHGSGFGPLSLEWFDLCGEDGADFAAAVNLAYQRIKTIVPGAPK